MSKYNFIKQDSIKHSREVVMEKIKKLQPLNYNKFMWWRTHTDKVIPLGKRAPLKNRILNGEFEFSSYYWQAQLSLYNALDKIDLKKHDSMFQMEICSIDFSRYKRLMIDFDKEESIRLKNLYDAFTESYKITKEELEEKFLNWGGDIYSFYEFAENFLNTTPMENRKNMRMRGRPKKINI